MCHRIRLPHAVLLEDFPDWMLRYSAEALALVGILYSLDGNRDMKIQHLLLLPYLPFQMPTVVD